MLAKLSSCVAGLVAGLLGAATAFGFPIQTVPHATRVESVINSFRQGPQSGPSVAARGTVGFVTVWEEQGDFPAGIKMRFLDADGSPQGDEVWIDRSGPSSIRPRVAAAANGGFVVAWADSQDSWFQRFDFLGSPQGDKVRVNFGTPLDAHPSLDVAMAPDGSFAVVFNENFLGGDTMLAQRYSASGVPAGAVTVLDFGTPRIFRSNARVTAGPDGSLLAVWQEVDGFFVMGNRFDAARGSWSGVFQVAGGPLNEISVPAPLLYADGTGVVVWNTLAGVVAQRLDAAGHLVGGFIGVSSNTDPTTEPAIAVDAGGNTLVIWRDIFMGTLRGSLFDPAWAPFAPPLGAVIPVGNSAFASSEASVAIDGGGRAEVVWTSGTLGLVVPVSIPPQNGEDGSSLGIVGQVYSTTFCDSGSEILCVGRNARFQMGVTWKNPATGETGNGRSLPLTRDSGAFWFFGSENLELIVKIVDGTPINGNFWLYGGSLSDVEYTLTVEDVAGGLTRTYHKPAGQLASLADVAAFPSAAPAERTGKEAKAGATADALAATSLSIAGHFIVSVQFTDPRTGLAGAATAVPLTDATGAFWFFDSTNLELTIKVLDGTSINGKFWVFYGGLSDVDYTITVTRTETGEVRTYHNPRGTLASHADTQAF